MTVDEKWLCFERSDRRGRWYISTKSEEDVLDGVFDWFVADVEDEGVARHVVYIHNRWLRQIDGL